MKHLRADERSHIAAPEKASPAANRNTKARTRRQVRTFSASSEETQMLERLASYHGCSKSAMLMNLVKKEFWRVFPAGTADVRPDESAWVRENQNVR